MRSKYTHQHLQQEQLQIHHHQQQRSKFLPMLCSSSTKQVVVLSHRRNSSTSSSSSSASEDPMSPRVGCMGQVKRNNRVVGFPSKSIVSGFTCTTTATTTCSSNTLISDQIRNYSSNSIVNYHKLKRFFSSKSLTGSPTTTIAAASAVTRSVTHKGKVNAGRKIYNSSRGRRGSTVRDYHGIVISRSKIDEQYAKSSMKNISENEKGCLVNLVELDPPLPVVKPQPPEQENNGENLSLWKRRSGGAPLKSLQLELTQQQSCILLLQATTV